VKNRFSVNFASVSRKQDAARYLKAFTASCPDVGTCGTQANSDACSGNDTSRAVVYRIQNLLPPVARPTLAAGYMGRYGESCCLPAHALFIHLISVKAQEACWLLVLLGPPNAKSPRREDRLHAVLSSCVSIHIPDPMPCSIVGSHTCLLEPPWKAGSLASILVKFSLRHGTCRL
jgi:hypothetical protein